MNEVQLLGRVSVVVCVCVLFVAATPAVADVLTVMWDGNADPVNGYIVYAGPAGGQSQRVDVGNTTSYSLTTAVAGTKYCFAVSAYLDPTAEGPKSAEVCGFSNQYPTLVNPGDQSALVGQPVSLQLVGSDPDGKPVSYGASGLPPGVSVMASTGYIAGTPSTSGRYAVTASVSDGVLSASQSFTWTINSTSSDSKPPTISISSPTTSSNYATSTSTISLAGTSADNVGVVAVTWTNDRGGFGTATGTTNWSISSIVLLGGANNITVTARDAAGNLGIATIAVAYLAPDTVAPTVSIVSPTTAPSYSTTSGALSLNGTAADDTQVTAVAWANDRGGNGTASGTTSWSVPLVTLLPGTNVITVVAQDGAGNRASDTLTVDYAAPSSAAFTLQGDALSRGRWTKVVLTWTTVDGRWADVFRDGAVVARTRNNSYYSENVSGSGSHEYQVCISGGGVCSNSLVLSY